MDQAIVPACLASAPRAVVAQFVSAARPVELSHSSTLMSPGAECSAIAFVESGRVRVYQVGEDGREVTLYRIERAECCVLTVACLLGRQPFPALASVEMAVQAWVVPAGVFHTWVGQHEFWRDYVFSLLGRRLGDVLRRIEDVAFRRIDARLAELLLRRTGAGRWPEIVTQQQLADELGTAREVVSRTMIRWRREGVLKASRGRIELVNRAAMEELSRRA